MPKNHSFRCWVPHCVNNRKRTRKPNSHFHAFPVKNPERCRKWLKAVGYEDLVYLPLHSLRIRYVCSEHFTEEDYGKHSATANLFFTAIPSKFPSGTTPLSDEILAEWPPKLASDQTTSQENVVDSPASPGISSSSSDKLLASVVSAGILESKVGPSDHTHSIVVSTTPSTAEKNIKCMELTMDVSSCSQNGTAGFLVQATNYQEARLPPLPQELLMSYVKDSSGKGLHDGDVLLGFVVQRGSTLDIVPVGPDHSMVVSSCHEEQMSSACPVSSSNHTNGVENVR